MVLATQYNQRKLIAERLALRSGIPFDQAYAVCLLIEAKMAESITGKARELWQRASKEKPSRYANSAIFFWPDFRIDLKKEIGFVDKGVQGEVIEVRLQQLVGLEIAVNDGKVLYKHIRPRGRKYDKEKARRLKRF